MFEIVRKGYNQKQVGEFVFKTNKIVTELKGKNAELLNEIALLEREIQILKDENQKNNEYVLKAVENENNNKKLYELEVEKLNELVNKWTQTLNEIREQFGQVSEVEKKSLNFQKELESQTQKVIDFNFKKKKSKKQKYPKYSNENDSKFYHKELLNKMRGFLSSVSSNSEKQPETRFDEYPTIDKNILREKSRQEGQDYASVVNKYLGEINTSIDEIDDAAAKDVEEDGGTLKFASYFPEPNESGFDLKEAINPKESLEDIMSDFDFYKPQLTVKKQK